MICPIPTEGQHELIGSTFPILHIKALAASEPLENYAANLFKAVENLRQHIVNKTLENKPLILLSIDEIDSILPTDNTASIYGMDVEAYLIMMKTLYAEQMPSVMVTALSTLGRVFDIAPTYAKVSNVLGEGTYQLQPVFVELPFDVHINHISEHQLQLEHVCTSDFISKFGRVL